MQYNNKNESIAKKLDIISQQIENVNLEDTTTVLETIQQAHHEIEEIARDNDIPILRAIVHWMALNVENNIDNEKQISKLLENKSYSNWIGHLASVLHKHESKLLPTLHHSLTSPEWIVKPSAPLLTGLASWLSIVKLEHENNLRIEAEEEAKQLLEEQALAESQSKALNIKLEQNENTDELLVESETSNPVEFVDDIEILNEALVSDDDINLQITKAKEANEEALQRQTVFEEIDLSVLDKEYDESDLIDEVSQISIDTEEAELPLIETEKSSLDDEDFEVSNLLDTALLEDAENFDQFEHSNPNEENELLDTTVSLNDDKTSADEFSSTDSLIDDALLSTNDSLVDSYLTTDTGNDDVDELAQETNEFSDINNNSSKKEELSSSSFEGQLNTIYQKLNTTRIPSKDIYSVSKSLQKQLDNLIQLSNDSSLTEITPIAEWTQRNIKLFEDNSSSNIEEFFNTGAVWSWIEQIQNCLSKSESSNCLNDITTTLTREEWLEPIDTDDLESLLVSLKNLINSDKSVEILSLEDNEESDINVTETTDENIFEVKSFDYPELLETSEQLEETSGISKTETKSISAEIESTGLQVTWDDNTHPELLMVYLEETPMQITELLALLTKISDQKADHEQKHTAARLAHTIKGGSAVVGITALSELAYRFETLLDHTKSHAVPDEILALLPIAGQCLEQTFDSIQLQTDCPSNFLTIFNKLDAYVSTIDEDDVAIELTAPTLPDFIQKQNSATVSESIQSENTSDSENELIDSLIEIDDISDESFEIDIVDIDNIEDNILDNTLIEQTTNEIQDELITEQLEEKSLEERVDDLLDETENHFESSNSAELERTDDVIKETVEDVAQITSNTSEAETKTISETSGFQLTWDDDTHPELLMVYLEETPTQINELVPLLHKISENTADSDEKHVASRMAHTIKGASAIVGITALSEMAYRLETLLDHSVKFNLPQDILEILPATAKCIESLFDAVQMQEEEPAEFYPLFKHLDHYVSNIEESDEPLELSAPVLPDFIVNQNKTSDLIIDSVLDEDVDVSIDQESKLDSKSFAEQESLTLDENVLESKIVTDSNNVTEDVVSINDALVTDDVTVVEHESSFNETESTEPEVAELKKLSKPDEIKDTTEEIDNIVMALVSISTKSSGIKSDLNHYLAELHRFDLIADISGYPELSLLSQWCQSNIELFAQSNDESTNTFVKSGEAWLWIEFVGASLNDPDDMSHMSSLSVELMRDDWAQAISMDDLQTVLLALRNIETSETENVEEYASDHNDSDEIISWDKDVHPELLAVYFNETPDQIIQVAELLQVISRGESTTEENKKAARIAHTIKGASGVVGLNSLVDLTHSLEDILDYSVNNTIPTETAELLAEASDCLEELFESIQSKQAAPEELPSILERLSKFSALLDHDRSAASTFLGTDSDINQDGFLTNVETISSEKTELTSEQKRIAKIDINESYIRVPVRVIDKLINLAGELVTTSSLVSDNLSNTLVTNKAIRNQDERVHNMLSELTNTIVKQEKDQHNLLSSLENSDFDSLEMDTYNELHSVASLLSESILDSQEIDLTLNSQLSDLSDKLRSLDKLNKDISDVILSSRMVSIKTIIPRLERIVRQTCRKTDKKAELVVTGKNIFIDTDILNGLVDPLLHMLRNSIDHGIETQEIRAEKNKNETGLIELSFVRDGNNILMSLKDDGAGIDPEIIYQKALHKDLITPDQEFSVSDTLKLILEPGFTTQENVTDISGRGVGMDVVNSSVQDLNGVLTIDSEINNGTTFNLIIPVTLITNTILLVRTANNVVAIPTDTIDQILYQEANTVISHDGSYFVIYEEQEVEIKSLAKLLSWGNLDIDFTKSYNVLIIRIEDQVHAIHIDSIISSREVVVKPLSPWISNAKGVIGACHLTDGGVAPVINLPSVVAQADIINSTLSASDKEQEIIISAPTATPKILVVDDSLSNRKALSLIIDKTEYDVITAVDGMDALKIMNENDIDLVFTDLEMPRMNGLELTQTVRAWTDKSKIPIVMITSRTTSKHRELAAKAGVDDYLTKPVVTETLLESIDTWLTSKISATA